MYKETMKRKTENLSEKLAAQINAQENKKIKKGTGCSGSQSEATKGASGQAPANPAEPSK